MQEKNNKKKMIFFCCSILSNSKNVFMCETQWKIFFCSAWNKKFSWKSFFQCVKMFCLLLSRVKKIFTSRFLLLILKHEQNVFFLVEKVSSLFEMAWKKIFFLHVTHMKFFLNNLEKKQKLLICPSGLPYTCETDWSLFFLTRKLRSRNRRLFL